MQKMVASVKKMSKMSTIDLMIREGTSIHGIADYLQKNNRSLSRKEATSNAFKFMQEWRGSQCKK